MEQNLGKIGQSVVINGELEAAEDLTIEGQVDGKISLERNVLTLGESGRITAEVLAKVVVVMGEVKGTITATETIDIRKTASVDGELIAPRVGIAEGAFFRGRIDMQRSGANKAKPANTDKKTPAAQQPSSQPRRTETGVPLVASSA